MPKPFVYASNGECKALYDQDGNLILGQTHGSDDFYMIQALLEKLGYELTAAGLPETDGEYPQTLS